MDPILTFEGDLIVKGKTLYPKPGYVQFKVEGAKELVGRLIEVWSDKLPDVITDSHVSGKITVEIFGKVVDNSVYAATLPQGKRIPGKAKSKKPKTKKVKDGTESV